MNIDISVIVPAYNEAAYIANCVDTIRKVLDECGLSYEILVVDNGSEDETAAFAQLPEECIRVIRLEKGTIGRARNAGAWASSGSLLAFIDADVLVTQEWAVALKQLVDDGNWRKSGYFGGYPYQIRESASVIENAWFDAIDRDRQSYLSGGNIIVSSSVMQESGGFNEELITGEDYEFCMRLQGQHNTNICFSEEFRVIHLGFPSAVGPFFQREMWHGMGDFQSLGIFLSSKVAVASAVFAVTAILSICTLLAGFYNLALISVSIHAVIPLLITLYKFRLRKLRYLGVQYCLCYLYLWARFSALFKLLTSKLD